MSPLTVWCSDPLIHSVDGSISLHFFCARSFEADSIQMVSDVFHLLKGGDPACINAQTHEGATMLLLGDVNFLVLVLFRSDRNPLPLGETPLHFALRGKCDESILSLLISHSADPSIATKRGTMKQFDKESVRVSVRVR